MPKYKVEKTTSVTFVYEIDALDEEDAKQYIQNLPQSGNILYPDDCINHKPKYEAAEIDE